MSSPPSHSHLGSQNRPRSMTQAQQPAQPCQPRSWSFSFPVRRRCVEGAVRHFSHGKSGITRADSAASAAIGASIVAADYWAFLRRVFGAVMARFLHLMLGSDLFKVGRDVCSDAGLVVLPGFLVWHGRGVMLVEMCCQMLTTKAWTRTQPLRIRKGHCRGLPPRPRPYPQPWQSEFA
jgi:hypothetical protein